MLIFSNTRRGFHNKWQKGGKVEKERGERKRGSAGGKRLESEEVCDLRKEREECVNSQGGLEKIQRGEEEEER